MIYFKKYQDKEDYIQIDYDEALKTVLGSFKDNDETRSMLTIPNRIKCIYSDIIVHSEDGMTAMAGLYNLLPMD